MRSDSHASSVEESESAERFLQDQLGCFHLGKHEDFEARMNLKMDLISKMMATAATYLVILCQFEFQNEVK
jgi:hypothetical protein